MFDQLKHERAWSANLLKDSYKDFLTEAEMESILNNRDIWMSGDEVIERLKQKKSIIEAEDQDDEEEIIEEAPKFKSKRKAKPVEESK